MYQICVSEDLVNWKAFSTPIGYLAGSFGGSANERELYIWGDSSTVFSTVDGTTWRSAFQFPDKISAASITDTGIVTTLGLNQVFFSSDLKVWTQQSTFPFHVFEMVGSYGEFWAGLSEDNIAVDIFVQVSLNSYYVLNEEQ